MQYIVACDGIDVKTRRTNIYLAKADIFIPKNLQLYREYSHSY